MSHVYTAGWGRRGVMALAVFVAATVFGLAEGAALARAGSSPSSSASPASGGGISTTMWYVVGIVVAFGGALIVVLLRRRGEGRADED
jgi:hypothetical protein